MRVFQVFAPFSARSVALVKAWAESWTAYGWTPRLLSAREIREAGSRARAVEARGGGFLVDGLTFNYGLRPGSRKTAIVGQGRRGWRGSKLVRFPEGSTEDQIREGSQWR